MVDLNEWLNELRRQPVVLAGGPGAGAVENLWCISVTEAEAREAGGAAFTRFIRSARDIRTAQVAAQDYSPVSFYAWHDEMAGQLRFSVARCAVEDLPFGAPVTVVDDVRTVVRDWVTSPYLGGIPFSELKELTREEAEATPDPPPVAIRVWVDQIA